MGEWEGALNAAGAPMTSFVEKPISELERREPRWNT